MLKNAAVLLLSLLGGSLLIYTAQRTYDLIALTLPPDKSIMAVFALAAFDGGLLLWSAYLIKGARGMWQRAISALMVAVSFIGVVVAFGADTMISSAERGVIAEQSPEFVTGVIWALVGIIALNIGAVVLIHITEPDVLRKIGEDERADRRAAAEVKAQSKIELAAISQLEADADTLAAQLAPELAGVWIDEMRTQYQARAKLLMSTHPKAQPQLAQPQPAFLSLNSETTLEPVLAKNGHK